MDISNTTDAKTAGPQATMFLPAERASRQEVLRQHALLASDPVLVDLLDSTLSLTVILNEQRQIVYANNAFRTQMNSADGNEALGVRFGEAAGCVRATQAPAGCGTTQACRECGAACATAGALAGRKVERTCRIRTQVCGFDLNLRLKATPFPYKGEEFVMISASDIEPELRRRQLEQIFFHDVLNTAGGVRGLLDVMRDAENPAAVRDYLPIAHRASHTLVDELLCQRDMAAAEVGELSITRTTVSTREFLIYLTGLFASHPLASGKCVVLASDNDDVKLTTDQTLLSRVLINLIKNALEAVPAGSAVTIDCRREGEAVSFLVSNPGYMPPQVQSQLFQRSFSTKSTGRGFGTYSCRLLTETYLGGRMSFFSNPRRGTTFRAEYPLEPARPLKPR